MSGGSQGRDSFSKERRQTRPASAPPTLGGALSKLFALKGLGNPHGDAQLARLWGDVAGERIASRTRVLGLNRGVLQVAVASSPMLGELASYHKSRLLEELRTREPRLKLRDIKFRLRGNLGANQGEPRP